MSGEMSVSRDSDSAAQVVPPGSSSPQPGQAGRPRPDGMTGGLIELLPIGLCICDTSATVVEYNRRAAELWGRFPRLGDKNERYCGSYRLYRPDGSFLPHDQSPVAHALVTGQPAHGVELIVERPDGSRRSVLTDAVVLRDAEGRLAGAASCALDVTDWKQAIEARHQKQKLEALGRFTGGIVHDLSNVFAALALNLNLIEKRLADSNAAKFVHDTRDAIKRGSAITQPLLAFSHGQALDVETVDINILVARMRNLLLSTLGRKVQLELRLGAVIESVRVDPAQLEVALLNLATNARVAMPEGGRLTIRTENRQLSAGDAELSPGDYVAISVADSGHGMSAEVLARAFEPFYTTREVGKGAGLGLSMALGIAKQHGGTIRINSRVGQGTTVEIYLPRAATATRESKAGADRYAPAATRSAVGTILVVDDDPKLREVAVDALSSFGCKVLYANSGPSALKIIRSTPSLDLLLVDYRMSGMNGVEVARRAREIRPALKALVMTGYAEAPGLLAACRGIAQVIRKPFRAADIEAHIGYPAQPASGTNPTSGMQTSLRDNDRGGTT